MIRLKKGIEKLIISIFFLNLIFILNYSAFSENLNKDKLDNNFSFGQLYNIILKRLNKEKDYSEIDNQIFSIIHTSKFLSEMGYKIISISDRSEFYYNTKKDINIKKAIEYKKSKGTLEGLGNANKKRLEDKITKTFEEVYKISKKYNTTLRTASYIVALNRLNEVHKDRGRF